jgi:hypothetical protein
MKKAVQKTKYSKRYSKQTNCSDIVSKRKHRFSRVRNPCFKSLSRSKRSVRGPGAAGARFGSSSKRPTRGAQLEIRLGKDLTGEQGYLRHVQSETSLTFWLYSSSGRGNKRTNSTNRPNSKCCIFANKRNWKKPFGAKTAKNKSYKKVQEQKISKLPVRRNKFTSKQQKNFGKVLLPYFGKQDF